MSTAGSHRAECFKHTDQTWTDRDHNVDSHLCRDNAGWYTVGELQCAVFCNMSYFVVCVTVYH